MLLAVFADRDQHRVLLGTDLGAKRAAGGEQAAIGLGSLVEGVSDLFQIPRSELKATPETGCDFITDLAPRIVTYGNMVAGVVAIERLMPRLEVAS